MGYIYKITNKINNKIYIGKTTKTIEERFKGHLYNSKKSNTYLSRAIRKHSIENFYIEEIEEVQDEELNNRERYWIGFYKSNYREIGYNCTVGGDGNNQINVNTIHDVNKLWDEGLTVTEIAKTISLHVATVKECLVKHCPTYSKEEQKRRGKISNTEKHATKVLQFDLFGNYIATYNSIKDTSKKLNMSAENIKKCCDKLIPNTGMYQFVFDGDIVPGKCENPILPYRPVCQKDLSGNIIAMYISASDAGRSLNVNSSCIRRCCYKQKKICKGYTWDFVSVLEYAEYISKNNTAIAA